MRWTAALLCLAAATVLTWWVLRDKDPVARAPSRPVAEAVADLPLSSTASQPPAPPVETATPAVRVQGRVRRPEELEWQGLLYAVGEIDGKRQRLGVHVTHEGAEYAAEIPFQGASSPWPIDFGICGPGFVRASRRIEVEPGGEYRVDFDFGPGGVLEGVVVDPEGRAVPDLEMLICEGDVPASFVSQWTVDVGRLLLDGSEPFALCRTDGAGRFSVAGLPPGTYALVSRDETWALKHEDGLAPDLRDLRISAQPAFSLVGSAIDQVTGAVVPTVKVEMVMRTPEAGTTLVGTCAGERLLMVWNPSRRHRKGCTAHVTVSAEGYEDYRTEFSYGPVQRKHHLRAQLAPKQPPILSEIIVESVAPTGRLVDFPLTFYLDAADDPDRRLELVRSERLGNGLYRIEGPVGRWVLHAQPAHGLIPDPTASVEIREGVEGRTRLPFPPHAIVRLSLRGFEDDVVVHVEAADGTWSLTTSDGRDGMVFVVTPGGWSVGVTGAADPAPQRVELVDGQEVVITFVR